MGIIYVYYNANRPNVGLMLDYSLHTRAKWGYVRRVTRRRITDSINAEFSTQTCLIASRGRPCCWWWLEARKEELLGDDDEMAYAHAVPSRSYN